MTAMAPARSTRRRLSPLALFEALATPHGVDRYLELVNPMLTVRDLRAEVTDVRRSTADTVTLTLRPTRQWRGFHAGQFVQITVEIDGVRRTRCYSPAVLAVPRRRPHRTHRSRRTPRASSRSTCTRTRRPASSSAYRRPRASSPCRTLARARCCSSAVVAGSLRCCRCCARCATRATPATSRSCTTRTTTPTWPTGENWMRSRRRTETSVSCTPTPTSP